MAPSGRGPEKEVSVAIDPEDVYRCLHSLYDDKIKPSYGVLRRRVAEQAPHSLSVSRQQLG